MRIRYSNEDFDCAQSLAHELTDLDRAQDRSAPAHGYSRENFAKARTLVRLADTYGEARERALAAT